jgi:hypothetical protein
VLEIFLGCFFEIASSDENFLADGLVGRVQFVVLFDAQVLLFEEAE